MHADLRIVAAVHAQPVAPDPDAFARHERLAVGELAAPRDRVLQRSGDANADEQRRDGRRRLHVREQRIAPAPLRRASPSVLDQRQPAFGELGSEPATLSMLSMPTACR